MPVSIEVHEERKAVLLEASGPIPASELIGAFRSFFAAHMPAFSNCRTWLSDYSEADLSEIQYKDIQQIARILLAASEENQELRVAIVAAEEVTRGMANQARTLGDVEGWPSRVFPSREDAQRWLGDSTQ